MATKNHSAGASTQSFDVGTVANINHVVEHIGCRSETVERRGRLMPRQHVAETSATPPFEVPAMSAEDLLYRLEGRVAAYGPANHPFWSRLGTAFKGLFQRKSVVGSIEEATQELGRISVTAARDGVKAALKARRSV